MIATTHNTEYLDRICKELQDQAIFKSEMKMYDHLIESASVLKSGCKEFCDAVEDHIIKSKRIINRL